MNNEEQEKLLDNPMFHGPGNCGYGWPSGWDGLVIGLIEGIKERLDANEGLQMKVLQIKEKFAELRFYYEFVSYSSPVDDEAIKEIQELITSACVESSHICQECGSEEGKRCSKFSYVLTACESCAEKNGLEIYG